MSALAGAGSCASSSSRRLQGYVIDRDELYQKIEETIALGGDQVLLQGGLHPELGLDWCVELLRTSNGGFRGSTSTASARRRSFTLPKSRDSR